MSRFKKIETSAPEFLLALSHMIENTIPYSATLYDSDSKQMLVTAGALVTLGIEIRPQLNLIVNLSQPLSNQYQIDPGVIALNLYNQVLMAFRNKIGVMFQRALRQ